MNYAFWVQVVNAILHFVLMGFELASVTGKDFAGAVGWLVYMGILFLFDIVEMVTVILYYRQVPAQPSTWAYAVSIFHLPSDILVWVLLFVFFGNHEWQALNRHFPLGSAQYAHLWFTTMAIGLASFLVDCLLFVLAAMDAVRTDAEALIKPAGKGSRHSSSSLTRRVV